MQTPAAKAKGMKLKTKTMNVMKTPVAKENMKARRLPAAKVDASQRTLIRLDDPAKECVIHLTLPMPYYEILRRLHPKDGPRLHAHVIPRRLLHDDGEVRRWPVLKTRAAYRRFATFTTTVVVMPIPPHPSTHRVTAD